MQLPNWKPATTIIMNKKPDGGKETPTATTGMREKTGDDIGTSEDATPSTTSKYLSENNDDCNHDCH